MKKKLFFAGYIAMGAGVLALGLHAPHFALAVQAATQDKNTTPSDVVFYDATATQPLPQVSALAEACGCPFCCKPPEL